MSKARELLFDFWRISGGFTFYPYQIALGISLRYWPCIFAPAIRIYFGCFKFWAYIKLSKKKETEE